MSHGVDDADLYFQTTRSEGWSLEEGIVKTGSFSIDQGVGVRAVSGEKTAFAYSDDLSWDSLLDAAHTVRSISAQGQGRKVARAGRPPRWPSRARSTRASTPSPRWTAPPRWRCSKRWSARQGQGPPREVQVMAGLASEYDVVLVARADGTHGRRCAPLVRLSVTVIAEQNPAGANPALPAAVVATAWRISTTRMVQSYVDEAVSYALTNLDARPAPAGEMVVVLGPGWPGILLHEAVGHGLEGDFNRKGSSAFAGRIGQRVAPRA